jgi:F0F1-type ATP synthase assembly protein I
MLDVGLVILIVLAALVMLIRGDPKWIYPAIIGAFALFLVPAVVMYTIAYFTPKGYGKNSPCLTSKRSGRGDPLGVK